MMTKAQIRLWAKTWHYPRLALVPPVKPGLDAWRVELQRADAMRLLAIENRITLWNERAERRSA